MGHGNTDIGGGCNPGGHARHHLHGDAPFGQVGGFFSSSTEQKGVTTLQAHHHSMVLGHLHQHSIGAGLGNRVMAAALADKTPHTSIGYKIQNLPRDKRVVNERIAMAKETLSLDGEQFRITWTGTHQINRSGLMRRGHGRAARSSIRA